MALSGAAGVPADLRGSAEPVRSGAVAAAGGVASPAAFDVAEATRLLEVGTPATEVARRFRISESWVSKRCAGARKAWLRRRNARICELSQRGLTQRAIAARVGCAQGSVSRVLAAEQRDWLRGAMRKLRERPAPRRDWDG